MAHTPDETQNLKRWDTATFYTQMRRGYTRIRHGYTRCDAATGGWDTVTRGEKRNRKLLSYIKNAALSPTCNRVSSACRISKICCVSSVTKLRLDRVYNPLWKGLIILFIKKQVWPKSRQKETQTKNVFLSLFKKWMINCSPSAAKSSSSQQLSVFSLCLICWPSRTRFLRGWHVIINKVFSPSTYSDFSSWRDQELTYNVHHLLTMFYLKAPFPG